MPTRTATLDPAATISAAVRELYDQLRELVDRGPTDDPGLLDELGKLTSRIRGRITRARKRAEVPPPAPAEPTPPAPAPVPAAPVVEPALAAVPAAIPPSPTVSDRVTVRLAEPERPPAPVAPARARAGRHRKPVWFRRYAARIWRLATRAADIVTTGAVLALLGVAAAVAGYASFVGLQQTDVPWAAPLFAFGYLAAGTYLLVVVGRALSRRWDR